MLPCLGSTRHNETKTKYNHQMVQCEGYLLPRLFKELEAAQVQDVLRVSHHQPSKSARRAPGIENTKATSGKKRELSPGNIELSST